METEVRNFNLQWASGVATALWGSFAPIQDMLIGVFIFTGVDFIVGALQVINERSVERCDGTLKVQKRGIRFINWLFH